MSDRMPLGAFYLGDGSCHFRVWAPFREHVEVHILGPEERYESLDKTPDGYHQARLEDIACGTLYYYRLDGEVERADPASRYQPQGVHGPSLVLDRRFPWQDEGWKGLPLNEYIIYELHVGTFTREGTFEAIIPHLDYLKDLGITAVELMPIAQFPGNRNWGYDGVFPFAVQNSYGGPRAFKKLVDSCHARGLAVVLDVVYNHLGPEGNYLGDFGPYFADRYKTPWGPAINFDGPYSDEVRDFVVSNAVYWCSEYHIDALRVDAVHGIFDFSARHVLEELADAIHELGAQLVRRTYVTAESDLNDARLIRPKDQGGFGLDAQWNDDFHHALHALLTEEVDGYYEDFGEFHQLVKALKEGFVYSGQRSNFRRRRHGNSSAGLPHARFVVFAQNHDQIGNRAYNERLAQLVSLEGLKLAAGLVLLNPSIPLLFMGEEYGETAPFPYFISHSDPELVEAVRKGRREEFEAFIRKGNPPDPQNEETFRSAQLNHELRVQEKHAKLLEFYRELITLRKQLWTPLDVSQTEAEISSLEPSRIMCIKYGKERHKAVAIFNVGTAKWAGSVPVRRGTWSIRLDSASLRWHGEKDESEEPNVYREDVALDLPGFSFVVLVEGSQSE